METTIYVLTDPNEGVKYVGKTTASLNRRLKAHIQESLRMKAKTIKAAWITRLLRSGLLPSIVPIDIVNGDGNDEEIKWIAKYRKDGVQLVNLTDGGEGVRAGYKHSGKALEHIASAARARCMSPELRNAAAKAARERVYTPEIRANMSAAQKGKPRPARSIEKMTATKRAWVQTDDGKAHLEKMWKCRKQTPCTDETRAKLSAAGKNRKHTPEAIAKIKASWVLRKQRKAA